MVSRFLIPLFVTFLFADYPFIPNIRVSDDSGGEVNQGESSFTVYGENIYAVCNIAERSVIPMIPYAYSLNGGLQWEPNLNFNDPTVGITWHTDPVIGVDDSGNVHMIVQFSVFLIKHYYSRDGGLTWIDTTDVSDPTTGGIVDKPWMIVKGNKVYVAWQEFGGSEEGIRFAKSIDYGATFERQTIDTTRRGLIALNMDDQGVLYLAYIYDGLYFTKSYDDGETWTPPVYLSNVIYSSGVGDRAPINSLAAYGDGVLFISWVDSRNGNWDILGMRSIDGGENWTGPFIVNDITTGGQCKGWVTFDPYGYLHIFWYHTPDWPTTTSSLWSVRYQYSADSGLSFTSSFRITDTTFLAHYFTDTTFMGDYHTIVTDSNYIYAIWTDGRDGNMNLYFSKAILPLSIEEKESKSSLPRLLSFEIQSPFRGRTLLKINLREGSRVDIKVYDVCGRFHKYLFKGKVKGGVHHIPVTMEGKSGIYFFYLDAGGERRVVKGVKVD
jgi:hypothetical protein